MGVGFIANLDSEPPNRHRRFPIVFIQERIQKRYTPKRHTLLLALLASHSPEADLLTFWFSLIWSMFRRGAKGDDLLFLGTNWACLALGFP